MVTFRSAFVLILTLLALAMPSPVPAAELGGAVRVVDGDSLRIGRTDVRLFGIDAPEQAQTCPHGGQGEGESGGQGGGGGEVWACGAWATVALRDMVRGREVTCEGQGTDRYGRMLGICRVDGVDLNAALVRQGAAIAYRRYSTAYVAQERAARNDRLGIWAGAVQAPEDFRRGIETSATSNGDCRIKGNISANGHIYHRPGQEHYDKTQVNTRAGERWFCSAAEAEAAGWRAARR